MNIYGNSALRTDYQMAGESPPTEKTKRDSKLKSAILAVTAVSKFKQKKQPVRPNSLDLSGCAFRYSLFCLFLAYFVFAIGSLQLLHKVRF